MTALVAIAVVIVGAVGLAVLVDRRDRRQGGARRSIRDMSMEATHHRVDIDAVPYEPARHAGQRDWATYRRRDRRRRS